MAQVQINGYLGADFDLQGPLCFSIGESNPALAGVHISRFVEIEDARVLQAAAASATAFFEANGFVLLAHRTAVRDWGEGLGAAGEDLDVARVYRPEVEEIIRRTLYPGARLDVWQPPAVTRRGRGAANSYANGVHNDFGLTADDYQENLAAFTSDDVAQRWRDRFDSPDVVGFTNIDFWRPTNMTAPLRHMPLAVCDPNSVRPQDMVATRLAGLTPTGRPANLLSLRYDPGHRWCWYPGMTTDEVLVLTLINIDKDEAGAQSRACFHSAVADPDAPDDAEPRQSCEHRVGVFRLRS